MLVEIKWEARHARRILATDYRRLKRSPQSQPPRAVVRSALEASQTSKRVRKMAGVPRAAERECAFSTTEGAAGGSEREIQSHRHPSRGPRGRSRGRSRVPLMVQRQRLSQTAARSNRLTELAL